MILKDLRPALRALLLSNAELKSMVGDNRVYPGRLPQGDVGPSIVYNEVSNVGGYTNDGPDALARPRYQIDAWAGTAADAAKLGLLVKETIDGYHGTITWGAGNSVVVRGVFMDASRAIFDDPSKLFGHSWDFIIWFTER